MVTIKTVFRGALTGLAATMMFAQTASALSCMRPDLAKTMEKAKASDKIYYVLVGNFIYEPIPNKKTKFDPNDQFKSKPPVITQTRFEGYSLTPEARTDVPLMGFPVDIETSCMGPWCSSPPSPKSTQIAFVEVRDGQAPLLRITPCPDMAFRVQPQDGQVDKLRTCFNGTCQSGQPDYY